MLIVVYFVSAYLWGLALKGMFTEEGVYLGMLIAMALGFGTVFAVDRLFPAKDSS